jgi:hypothetical protein
MKPRLCRWNCGRKTERRCGVCIQCCDARDDKNRQIDAGKMPYIPPNERPWHRFYERKQISATKREVLKRASDAAQNAKISRPNAQPDGFKEI